MIRKLLWFIPVAGLAAALVLAPVAAAQEQPGVEFAVEPGPRSQTEAGGGYFKIEAGAGEVVRQSISLRNESGRRLTLELTAVDATTGQLGGASYGVPNDPVEQTGTWIELERTRVPLKPGDSATVGFEVTVPEDATGGEHLAGIAVAEASKEEKKRGDEPVSIAVNTRRIIAVQVDLPGPKVPELVITGVTPAARPDGLYLEIGIENQGTAITSGEGTIEVPTQAFLQNFAVDTFIPATSIAYPVKWTDDPREGAYEAAVELEYDGGVAEWAGTFTVGDPVLDELEDRGANVPANFPILPVGAAVVAIVGGLLAWWILRRRSHPMTAAPAGQRGGAVSTRTYPLPTASPASKPAVSPSLHDAPQPVRPRYPTSGPPPPPPPPPASGGTSARGPRPAQ